MINVVNKKCLECDTSPNFNFKGLKAIYCSLHRKTDMIDVNHRKCLECNNQPSFNFKGKKAIYCATHTKIGMIDVINKLCLNCNKRPSFNFENEMYPIYCIDHIKNGMVDIINRKCKKCNKQPNYNYQNEKIAIYCYDHMEIGMIDVRHKMCIGCNMIRCNKDYNYYCSGCYYNKCPEKSIIRKYKTKETTIMMDLIEIFPGLIRDRTIRGGCSKKRPDGLIKCSNHNIIVEIDENQHNTVGYSCENLRSMELFQDLRNLPLVLIRFNPDKYIQNKKTIKSLFSVTKITG